MGCNETIGASLEGAGLSRREFVSMVGKLAATTPLGLMLGGQLSPEAFADEVMQAKRPSVAWLHFQDCTGCSETLLRTSQPDLADLLLNVISLDYHETLMAASGHQAEECLQDILSNHWGEFVCVVEGSIPRRHGGVYMKLAGKPAMEVMDEVANGAAAVIAIGSCASWGGVPSAMPNPTDAVSVDSIVPETTAVVNIPGCPPNPYTLLGVVLQFVKAGTLPALDDKKRPKFAYDRVIHEHCPRRPHFDAGEFAEQFGDEGHRKGWCLYQLGCKGPVTHARCSTRHFNEVVGAWPIGIGAPCVGCTEQDTAFKTPMFDIAKLHSATPPSAYPVVEAQVQDQVDPIATAVVGAVGGAIAGGAYVASRRVRLTVRGQSGALEAEGPESTDQQEAS